MLAAASCKEETSYGATLDWGTFVLRGKGPVEGMDDVVEVRRLLPSGQPVGGVGDSASNSQVSGLDLSTTSSSHLTRSS